MPKRKRSGKAPWSAIPTCIPPLLHEISFHSFLLAFLVCFFCWRALFRSSFSFRVPFYSSTLPLSPFWLPIYSTFRLCTALPLAALPTFFSSPTGPCMMIFCIPTQVDWFVKRGQTTSRVEAVAVGCSLLEHGFLHHVCDDHHFKDEGMYYRFRWGGERGVLCVRFARGSASSVFRGGAIRMHLLSTTTAFIPPDPSQPPLHPPQTGWRLGHCCTAARKAVPGGGATCRTDPELPRIAWAALDPVTYVHRALHTTYCALHTARYAPQWTARHIHDQRII